MTQKPKGRQGRGEKEYMKKTICVLGPSFVGKTQIVNRLVNNAFFPQYHPTDELDTYKIFYNRAQAVGSQPDFVQIEIKDSFPQDHPLLFTDASNNDDAKTMQDNLKWIIQNTPEKSDDGQPSGPKPIQAYIFVYDANDRESFQKLLKIIQSVSEFEESNALGREEEEGSRAQKYVIGTKKDLKEKKRVLLAEDMAKLQSFNADNTISLQEVSSLTAYGIHEVFTSLIQEVVGKASAADMAQHNQNRGGQAAQESGGGDSENEEEDSQSSDEEEEEVKGGEAPNSGEPTSKARNQMVTQGQDAVSKMLSKKQSRPRRGESNDQGDVSKNGLAKGSKTRDRGKSQTQQQSEEQYSTKGMFQSLMPFLFQKEPEKGGKGRSRK